MVDSNTGPSQRPSLSGRLERRLLSVFPSFITPLRFRILVGYLIVFFLGIYGREQIATAWLYFATLLAPVTALLGALLALKLSVVAVSLLTLFTAVVKLFFGFLAVVLKPGILKAIFIPQLLSLVGWLHGKSSRVQSWVKKVYERAKAQYNRVVEWWRRQATADKLLLFGFLIPLLLLVLIVFIVKRAIAIFAVKKLTEQVVQRSTKYLISNFHRIPLIGGIPAFFAARTRRLTVRKDRDAVVQDLQELGSEFYRANDSQSNTPKA